MSDNFECCSRSKAEHGSPSIASFIGVKHIGRIGETENGNTASNILERNGKKAFAVLPYEEFVKIEEELDDLEDIKNLRAIKAEEANAPTASLASVRKELKL